MAESLRYSDLELEIAKNTFANNDILLGSVKKILLGLEISESERTLVSDKINGNVISFLRKVLLPVIDGRENVGQEYDMWISLDALDKTPEQVDIMVKARAKLIDMMDEGLTSLETKKPVKDVTRFKGSADPKKQMIDLIARNTYLTHVRTGLINIKVLAGLKAETIEEQKKRLTVNSTK
jgi:hypothetical protein